MNKLTQQAKQIAKVSHYDKYYKWLKFRNFKRIFNEYVNVPFTSVLFAIRPKGKYTEVAIFENVEFTDKEIQPFVTISDDTIQCLEDLCNENNFQPVNVIFTKDYKQPTKWTFRLAQ